MAEEIIELKNLKERNKSEKASCAQGATVLEQEDVVSGSNGKEGTHDYGRSKNTQYYDSEEKQRKERWVDKRIESRIDKVRLVKPSMLKGQLTNSLEKAMVYSSRLRERAEYSSIDEAELKAIGSSMEEYAFHLIEPLKDDVVKRAIFIGSFGPIAEKAVLLKQKKFLAHPIMYNLLRKRWTRRFYHWNRTTKFGSDWFMWMFLNFWTIFDIFLFPVIYFVSFSIQKCGRLRTASGVPRQSDVFAISYHDYFTTPYFIFLRDTLSYFVLLALHFAMCIQPSTLHFTVVEWIILLFFLGRFMMEVYQAVNGLQNEKEMNEERIDKRRLRDQLSRMLSKYLSDQWNVLDVTNLIVYVILLILRVITWSAYTSVLNNRLLAVTGYLYGLNSMLLTLRVFGHITELIKTTGIIQIALFQILGPVLAVFGQFFAILVAFSLAISKVRMTEMSFTGTSSIISLKSWWNIARHLFWSLLVEPELLQSSIDETSNVLIQILYGLFLIMAVVMLMNMMIALLTNTYQQVEDNAFYEWSYKKAATINTYCNYHSIPVPFNIISLTFLLVRYICKKICCKKCATADIDNDPEKERRQRNKSHDKMLFNRMIIDLESIYYSVYGDDFPITGDRLDHVVKQTEGNHHLIGHIAERLFTYGSNRTEGGGSDSRQEWDVKGIHVLGNRLSYDSCNCHHCSSDYQEYHGARYRVPFSPEMPGFEILIEEGSANNHDLTLGVVDKDFDLHKVPGMEGNSVGYQVEKEIICDITTQRTNYWPKIDNLPEMADRGDLLSCEILYGRESSNNTLPVLFTLNGREIGEGTIENGDSSAGRFYAFIGIGSQEISVRFKQRYLKRVSHGEDHSSILLKQVLDQLSQLNKNYYELKEEVQAIRSKMENNSGKMVITPL